MDFEFHLLLKRYMQHVRDCEGVDFTERLPQSDPGSIRLTENECEILRELAVELDRDGA